mmetsp:Transcript_47551/g.119719  ORF Transcript_47551/g.119719 Transcript_47551/m.119719 type:complete len:540 (-) Transcript_47551:74-1693(-)|eukprot:CAMPEP_0177648200 /NCGR_PEP_ID=MMETSP0447-20121125/10704_1 /TAXON_ID=0 /ORGANISM="Stygamoeba regulata, Strain BSH-02190019" /LENGTH=539 /DNA_ID=CAMNT_0019150831 /DNA_START=143 /DNA_END=1762 /DNA_ORIENTATION=-
MASPCSSICLPLFLLATLFCCYVWAGESVDGIPFKNGGDDATSFARRIEYQTVTVDDMELARTFYVDVLGGTEVPLCPTGTPAPYCSCDGSVVFAGDTHRRALFAFELAANERVPDIGEGGSYEVHSRFIVFGNAVVQLMQFVERRTSSDPCGRPATFNLREPRTSPCWLGAAHIDFWTEDSVDMNKFIAAAELAAGGMGMPNVAWNRPVPQEHRSDRARVPQSEYSNHVDDGAFGGLWWSYFKGPVAEQLELYRITGTMKRNVGREYCRRGAVSPAFLDQKEKDERPITKRLHGMFQFGYRTDDLNAAVGFYTEVMGGDVIPYPTHGIDIRGDDAHWMILANETLQAYEVSRALSMDRDVAMRTLGVANISAAGGMRLDHRFILFDNFVVEPLLYTDGLTIGGRGFNPRWGHATSPAYIGAIVASFGGSPTRDLKSALRGLKQRAVLAGFGHAFIPEEVATFPDNHPYSGLEYAYGKGQAGEAIGFVSIGGAFADALEQVILRIGGVSTLFDSTNAFAKGDMNNFCKSVQVDTAPRRG